MSKQSFRVTKREGGLKLVAFLRLHCPETISAKAIKRAIDAKLCRVNGRIETISTYPLNISDRVEIELTLAQKSTPTILFEDDDLLVINKTPQLICDLAPINTLFPHCQGKLQLIHRLDKETSGVLLIAKNECFKVKMVALFREKGVRKIYHAIVDGVVEGNRGKCQSRLAKIRGHGGETVWGSVQSREGKEAISLWRRLMGCKTATYLELQPLTGRTHQLRVHMSEMGHPIVGDVHYRLSRLKRFKCPYQPPRNLLHALAIAFVHPTTGKAVSFEAPLPNDFKNAVETLF